MTSRHMLGTVRMSLDQLRRFIDRSYSMGWEPDAEVFAEVGASGELMSVWVYETEVS